MIVLKIKAIKNNKYLLLDEKQNVFYNLFFEFYGLEPKINDSITFDERFLNSSWEGYAQPYAFELVKNQKEYNENKKSEYAVLTLAGKDFLLRRIYG